MKIKTPKDHDFEKIYKAYAGLIEWIGGNDVDGQETLGLLIKASVSLAVTNRLAKERARAKAKIRSKSHINTINQINPSLSKKLKNCLISQLNHSLVTRYKHKYNKK